MSNRFIYNFSKAFRAAFTRKIQFDIDRIPFEFNHISIKKILNWILTEGSAYVKPTTPWGYPTLLQIEPSTVCNLKCALCPFTEGMDRPPCFMESGLFKKLIDEIGAYVFLLLLWDWGEPFLNPSIYEMIAYANERHIKTVSSTNGHPFANQENAEQLVRSGIDAIIFAVDGITQKTYERYRVKGDLETVFTGVKNVVAAKRSLNSKTPLINFRFIVMKHNEHELSDLKGVTDSLGVDLVTLKTMNSYVNNSYSDFPVNANLDELIPETYRRYHYEKDTNLPQAIAVNPCKALWNNPAIHAGGLVCPCTFDYNEKYVLGDLNRDTFKTIWFGNAYRHVRRSFRQDWEKIPICQGCTYAYKGGNLISETVINPFQKAIIKKVES
jgi:radical SAM protein with 4Fe4S-binding SPASM domain